MSARVHQGVLLTLLLALAVSLSFGVLGKSPEEELKDRLCERGQVTGGIRVEIFMVVDAAPGEVGSVKRFLEESSRVREFDYLDKDAAFEEFKRIFHDNPDLVDNIDPQDLPTSFRVTPDRPEDARPLKREVIEISGVDDAVVPSRALEDLCDV